MDYTLYFNGKPVNKELKHQDSWMFSADQLESFLGCNRKEVNLRMDRMKSELESFGLDIEDFMHDYVSDYGNGFAPRRTYLTLKGIEYLSLSFRKEIRPMFYKFVTIKTKENIEYFKRIEARRKQRENDDFYI